MIKWWPLKIVTAHAWRMLNLENSTLRTDLGNAMVELRRHRLLIAGLRTGEPEITRAVEKARQ